MNVVPGVVIRRIAEVSSGADSRDELLASVGLSPNVDPGQWLRETVDEDSYYDFLERAAADDDFGLPFRYADTVQVDDFGALGLALKTATTLRESLLEDGPVHPRAQRHPRVRDSRCGRGRRVRAAPT